MNRCHLPVYRSPRKAIPISPAPRRIKDQDSFPFPKNVPKFTPTSPEEEGMMNSTMDRTRMHMLNHEIRFRKVAPMAISFHHGHWCRMFGSFMLIVSNMRTMPVF